LLYRMKHIMLVLTYSSLVAVSVVAEESKNKSEASYQQELDEYCKGVTAPIKQAKSTKVFSWTDDNGVVHFGDRPPAAANFEEQKLQGHGKDYFDMNIQYPSDDVPKNIGDTVAVGGRAIYRAFEQFIPRSRLSKSSIDMRVYGNRAAFFAYKDEVAPNLSNNVTGFFSGRENTVAVLHHGNDDETRRVALHEVTHVIEFQNLGYLSGWLSEGLAEYFELAVVKGQRATVEVNPYWVRYLRNARQVQLMTLLTADYSHWQGVDGAAFYGSSWALTYFLMMPDNRDLMSEYQKLVSEEKCDETDSVAFFNERYKNGVRGLESDLRKWLDGPHKVPNYH